MKLQWFLSMLLAAQAGAAIITYTFRTAFMAAIEPNSFSYTVSARGGVGQSTTHDVIALRSLVPEVPMVIQIDAGAPTAFGGNFFLLGDFFHYGGEAKLTADNGVDPIVTLAVIDPGGQAGIDQFFGFISTGAPLTALVFMKTGMDEQLRMDNLVVGTVAAPTPEPGSLALLGAGLAALWCIRRRAT